MLTPFATTISPWQACALWATLEDALAGRASHGHTAEVYAYTLLPWDPSVVEGIRRGADSAGTIFEEPQHIAAGMARDALVSVAEAFARARECVVVIEGRLPDTWGGTSMGFLHRVKVEVRPC